MTEDEAQTWFDEWFGVDARRRVGAFLIRVAAENARQNLVSPATIASIWVRHALDSAQLLLLAPPDWRTWLDIGTGAGFPGMVVALLRPERQVILVEPRRKRVAFLEESASALGLTNVTILASKIEAVSRPADVISARAVSSIENLLRAGSACATERTTWLLPRGRSGRDELALAGPMFHVEQSLTDPLSAIGVYRGLVPA